MNIIGFFEKIPDVRQISKVQHPLIEIIYIAIVSTVAGADDWAEIEVFANDKIDWFKKRLLLPYGIPSHDTFERVFRAIDPKIFLQCFMEWTSMVSMVTEGGIVALDGKTMRHTFDKNKRPLHVVSAWFSETGLVLGQVKTREKSNEIKAIPELLDILSIKGCIVTIDAMGTQKEIAAKIKEKKADYVLSLKGNHPLLNEEVSSYFDTILNDKIEKSKVKHCRTTNKGHGRIEVRDYYITKDIKWLESKNDWVGLKTIGKVVYSKIEDEVKVTDTRYFICSIEDDPDKFAYAVRNHWGIESMHWSLDVTFMEDSKRVRKDNAPENLSILLKMAFNIIKTDTSIKKSMKTKRRKAGWNLDFLEQLLTCNK